MIIEPSSKKKIKYAFLSPVGNILSGKSIKPYLELQKFAIKFNFPLIVMQGRTHADARNFLATGGHGFEEPYYLADKVENFIWIDSDHFFKQEDLEYLMEAKYPFCAGWYLSGVHKNAENDIAAGYWDEEYFCRNKKMRFLSSSNLLQSDSDMLVDFTGFGFVKIDSSIFKSLEYPFFRHDVHRVNEWQDNSSEDVSFCLNVYNKTGIKPMVLSKLKILHLKEVYI